jgi:hypothetical protein
MIMENKVLIKLLVPELDTTFDVFIPVNELIWKIKKLLVKCIGDFTGVKLDMNKEYILLNVLNSRVYSSNEIVIETDIRNSTELVLMTKKS